MSTKSSIKHHHGQDGSPAWHLYEESFEKDDVVYLELHGVPADIVMIDNMWDRAGTVRLKLPVETAKQLGLLNDVPPGKSKFSRRV